MTLFIGIDNGKKGGIVAINHHQEIKARYVMPMDKDNEYDIKKLTNIFKLLSEQDKIHVCIEHAYVRPISGKRACFMNGYGYGVIQGVLTALNIEYDIVRPNEWMKIVLGTQRPVGKESIPWCQRTYPNEDWTATPRSTVPHDGLTDSCCIAYYCFRKHIIHYE